jgi:two-component system cell cycle sensor histidine kinase/response regulator CckA
MKKKILIVDNNPLILQLMTDLLKDEGYQVLTAEDGLSALDILRTYKPDVFFIDLVMPNIDGKKLCQIIRGMPELKDVFIVIISATAAEEKIELDELGADAYIAKVKFNEMGEHILATLDQLERKTSEELAQKIRGIKNLYPREITRELLSINRHFEVILDSMSEGILEITPEKRIVYANPAAIPLVGIPEERLLGKTLSNILTSPDDEIIERLLASMNDAPRTVTQEVILGSSKIPVLLHVVPLDGEEHEAVIILNDLSERKRTEEELQRYHNHLAELVDERTADLQREISERKQLEAQLQQYQKMEAIGTLAGGIAHDFNNLLMGILGHASFMSLTVKDDHPHREPLKGIEKMVRRGADLTRQLLGFARGGRYEVKATDINQLIEKSAKLFGRTKKEIQIGKKMQKGVWPVEVDRGQIEQVLLNLYVNAGQAMPKGGELLLQTENAFLDASYVEVFQAKPGKYVKITVTDTGIGMDTETQKRIFEPFYTTKEIGTGSGLGLASAYGIVRNHEGIIDVSSEKGKGSTFSIFLPVSDAEVIKGKKASQETPRGTETVLLIDDEDMILEAGEKMATSLGYTVILARSGKEGIATYEEKKEEIGIVVLDMIMPAMGGGAVYDRLKEIDPKIKVLLSSGYSLDGEANDILGRGCDGFIQKPFDMKQLSKKLRDILDKA